MTDRTLKYLVALTIALLLVFQIGSLIAGLFGAAWGAVSAIVVAIVSFFSARLARAGGKSSIWFLLPTILFTIVPLALKVWDTMSTDTGFLDHILSLAPFVVGFATPVVLLLVVYYELRRRTRDGPSA